MVNPIPIDSEVDDFVENDLSNQDADFINPEKISHNPAENTTENLAENTTENTAQNTAENTAEKEPLLLTESMESHFSFPLFQE